MTDFLNYYREMGIQIFYQNATDIPSREIKCGYCDSIVAPHKGYSITAGKNGSIIAHIYQCPHCMNPIIYFSESNTTVPGSMWGRDIKNLPSSIQSLYLECRTCYANQCYTASQMIARTMLMHIAVEQGAAPNLGFAYYVDYLDEKGYIPPNGKKWVDYIRKTGNKVNHEIIIKGKEETEKVITFLSTLLLFIYELPNELDLVEGDHND